MYAYVYMNKTQYNEVRRNRGNGGNNGGSVT